MDEGRVTMVTVCRGNPRPEKGDDGDGFSLITRVGRFQITTYTGDMGKTVTTVTRALKQELRP